MTTTTMSEPATQTTTTSFAYRAQTPEGHAISGTIEAPSADEARRMLALMRVRVLELEDVERKRVRPLSGDDFQAFNQQLAHLTSAGMPVEQGLRLIAQDMRSGRLASTIRAVVAEMEKGSSLQQAFDAHRDRFPPLYARLIGAGVSAGDLPGMLMNLGRHLEMVQRLRAALWRATAYPLMVLAAVAMIALFLGFFVVPQFALLFDDVRVQLPTITRLILATPRYMPAAAISLASIIVLVPIVWLILKSTGKHRAFIDRMIVPLPLIGPILRNNLVARWCDAVGIGIKAGLDLPRAIDLAGEVVASPALKRDGEELSAALQSGRTLESVKHTRILPASVAAAMGLATRQAALAETMRTLTEMYQQQADMRVAVLPAILTPFLIVIIAVVIGVIIAALFLPFISLLSSLM